MIKLKMNRMISVICLAFTLLLAVIVVFGWYAYNTSASVSSGSGSTKENGGDIIIRKEKTGDDISVMTSETPTTTLDMEVNDGTKLSPDSYGSFLLYTDYNVSSHLDTYRAILSFEIKASLVLDSRHQEEALNYINSHILFFKSYDATNHIFSNWISPAGATYDFTESEESYMNEIRVYWVWVGNYEDIYEPSNTKLIQASDKVSIRSYYESTLSKVFDSGEKSEENYNAADYVIGTSLSKVYVEITAKKGEIA